MPRCYLCSTLLLYQNQIVLTIMKRILNRMLRYADAIVKRGVDKLIDAIGHNPELQTKNAETQAPNATSNGGDASRGKRFSYYLVEFVFSFFLYPDAGRVAPISVCVFCNAFLSNLKMPQNGLAKRSILNALLVRAKALLYYVLWSFTRQ